VDADAGRFRAASGSNAGFDPSGLDTGATDEDAPSSDEATSVLTESSRSAPRVPSGTTSRNQLLKMAFGSVRQRTRQLKDLDRFVRFPALQT